MHHYQSVLDGCYWIVDKVVNDSLCRPSFSTVYEVYFFRVCLLLHLTHEHNRPQTQIAIHSESYSIPPEDLVDTLKLCVVVDINWTLKSPLLLSPDINGCEQTDHMERML